MNSVPSLSRGASGIKDFLRLVSAFGVTAFLALSSVEAVVAGAKVTFLASADGSPAPTFQWKKNGVAIPGATAATLVFSSVSLSDAGTYRVTALNVAGSADSADEVLLVDGAPAPSNVAPVFTTQPALTVAATAGDSVTLSASASGTPAPSFQWSKNGTPISGATGSSLVLTNVAAGDAGTYFATATNLVGAVVSSSTLVTVSVPSVTSPPPPVAVNVAPVVTTQPSAQSVVSGASVSLSVSATGNPAPAYQWQKNGTPISGATGATFAISNVAATDGGNYSAVVSNLAGSVTSSDALLTVTSPVISQPAVYSPPPQVTSSGGGTSTSTAPSITMQPLANQFAAAGADVRLSVVATGSAVLSYQWRKNGSTISGATGASLLLANVGSSDAGTYVVVISNSAGSVTSASALVSVGGKPVFSSQPAGQAVNLGARVVLSATAIGNPTPTLQWTKNGTSIAGATASSYVISSIRESDLGSYRAIATNTQGAVSSNAATLVLAAAPVINAQPAAQTVVSGNPATFSITVSASPAPDFQWKKNGVKITGATNNTLVLDRITASDAGDYSVEASNVVGWVVSNRASLTVTPPSASSTKIRANGAPEEDTTVAAAPQSRIVNLSVRSRAGSGDNALIVGFVIGGGSTKSMLLRGVGPALAEFGVADVLSDPKLSLFAGSVLTASNDDWALDANAPKVASTSAVLGAFSLREASADSAMLADLSAGAYTVQVGSKDSETGVALVEVYDAAASAPAALVNLSVRTFVGAGSEAPNLGFVVSGSTAKRVLIRAVGPTLGEFGVAGVLADPQLELFKNGARIANNDNWDGDAALVSAFSSVGAFGLANPNSKDAVILATLEPGAYTVIASGVAGSTGIALVEVYDVP